jgi:GTP:adenosylcobinamide-phosphate guanylyltransferase
VNVDVEPAVVRRVSLETRMDQLDVVLPAGGRISGEFARAAGVEIKALILVDGQPILRHTIQAMRDSGRVRRIAVTGPREALDVARDAGADGLVEEGTSGPENVFRGLDWLREQTQGIASRLLIAATDLPFLTPDSIRTFVDLCPPEAEAALAIVTRQAFMDRFPGSENIWVPLREGDITNGSVFLVDPGILIRNRVRFEQMFEARKSQIQMARLVGLRILFELLTHRLSLATLERRCSGIMGGRGKAVLNCPAELAFDVDQFSEYRYLDAAPEQH